VKPLQLFLEPFPDVFARPASTRISVSLKAPTSRPLIDPFLMPAFLSIGGKPLPHPQFQLQWLCNTHQRTQFNVSQPNSMTIFSIAASDLRIMIGSVHSLDFPPLLDFSIAHTTHPKSRFRHPTPKTVSSFLPVSYPRKEIEYLFSESLKKMPNLRELHGQGHAPPFFLIRFCSFLPSNPRTPQKKTHNLTALRDFAIIAKPQSPAGEETEATF
jgi:hypothetical protein